MHGAEGTTSSTRCNMARSRGNRRADIRTAGISQEISSFAVWKRLHYHGKEQHNLPEISCEALTRNECTGNHERLDNCISSPQCADVSSAVRQSFHEDVELSTSVARGRKGATCSSASAEKVITRLSVPLHSNGSGQSTHVAHRVASTFQEAIE